MRFVYGECGNTINKQNGYKSMTERDSNRSDLILNSKLIQEEDPGLVEAFRQSIDNRFGWAGIFSIQDDEGQALAIQKDGLFKRKITTACKDQEGSIKVMETSTNYFSDMVEDVRKVAEKAILNATYKYGINGNDIVTAFHTQGFSKIVPRTLSFPVEGASPLDTFCANPTITEIRAAGTVVNR